MKSKKIVAMIVAFAAFMAVATSGLAATTSTTTTYYTGSDKVQVDVDVFGAEADSEVTYLVENTKNGIVYIDQQTADENGDVKFSYKIANTKLDDDFISEVKFGTDGEIDVVASDADVIAFDKVTKSGDNVTITFYEDVDCNSAIDGTPIVGTADKIYAKVEVAKGYRIETTTGLGEATGNVYEVIGTDVSVVTEEIPAAADTTHGVTIVDEDKEIEIEDDKGNKVPAKTVTTVIKVVGMPSEVGVTYTDATYGTLNYPALTTDKELFTETDGLCAVRIIVGKDVVVDSSNLTTYAK